MSKKASRYLFYLIHCGVVFLITATLIYITLYRNVYNQYLSFIIHKICWIFSIINLIVIMFTHKLLKLDKTKKYYVKIFLNYLIISVLSCLIFYFSLYTYIAIELSIHGLY